MSNIGFEKLDEALPIYKNALVKVTQMNHIIEVVHTAYESDTLESYQKIDKEHYIIVDRDTGEILETKEYALNENRSQNTAGLKRTFKNIRDLINNNFNGAKNELFITLTYRFIDGQPMSDIKKASVDFDRFIKRFRRRYPDMDYIAVLEPQGNTAWHWHILAKFKSWHKKSHIRIENNSVIEPLWGHGFTKTKALRHVDNIGAYLSAYLTSVEVNEEDKEDIFNNVLKGGGQYDLIEKEVTGEDGKKVAKKFLKGARLHLYPSGANIYRYSRGIKKPVSQKMTYSEVKEIIGLKKPDFSRTVKIISTDSAEEKTYNSITYEHYNLKRKC